MRADDVRDWLRHRPFLPFRIHLTNNVTFDIRHPDQGAVSGSTLEVAALPTGATASPSLVRNVTVSLVHITHIEPLPPATLGDGPDPGLDGSNDAV